MLQVLVWLLTMNCLRLLSIDRVLVKGLYYFEIIFIGTFIFISAVQSNLINIQC